MDPATIASTQFSTREFDVWREAIAVVFDVERSLQDAGSPFDATVEAFQLGEMVVAHAKVGKQRYARSAARVRRDGLDHFVLNLYRKGGWRAQTQHGEFEGGAGMVSVFDLANEFVSDEPDSELVALFLPRLLLEDRLPELGALHGRAPTGPYATLLAEFLDLVVRRLPTLPASEEQALSRATCEMLITCFAPSLANVAATRAGLELVLQRRARRFIEANLGCPELATEAICDAVGVSRRALYRLFEREGGVQHYIQSRRLDRIRSLLSDPSENRRISEVAAEFGFQRSDHFARTFKHRYGLSARDQRDQALLGHKATRSPTSDNCAETQGFDAWIRALSS